MAVYSTRRSFRNTQNLYGLIKNRKIVLQMFTDAFKGRYSFSFFTILFFILGFAYIVFPLDLIPDFIPIIGWIDDGAVIYFLARRILKETERYSSYKR